MFLNLSKLESQNLEMAIKAKSIQIEELKSTINSDTQQLGLPPTDTLNLKNHYRSKLDFYQSQNNTKWKHWPNKTKNLLRLLQSQTNKRRNLKKRQHRKDRRAERDARRALETGSVVVLVDEDIPPGALALLGKGLGYVPTPSKDKIELRLDMKLVTNKILNYSNRVLAGETANI